MDMLCTIWIYFNDSHKTVQSSIDIAEEKLQDYNPERLVTRKKEKKVYHHPHTDSASTLYQQKASTAATKRDRPPLGQQKNTTKIVQNPTLMRTSSTITRWQRRQSRVATV
jgi:hypothetical protein